jgi:thiamine-phosphate pyrophosphorylase
MFDLHLITDRHLYKQTLEEVAACAEESGIDYFQLREKDLRDDELYRLAVSIRPLLKSNKFILNGRLDVALAAGADGVHLQRENLPVGVVKKKNPGLIVGYSAHEEEEMKLAVRDGADYVFVSPVYPTKSKDRALGLETVKAWTAAEKNYPVVALGGIRQKDLEAFQKLGLKGVAGISLFIEDGIFIKPYVR